MKNALLLYFLLSTSLSGIAQVNGKNVAIPLPTKAQLRWQNYEQTMFVCLDPCTWQGREYDNHSTQLIRINPTELNTDQLMNTYYKSVGRGAVLLLNSTPDTTGLIPISHVKAYAEFGKEIKRRFENPIGKTKGEGKSFEINFSKPTEINLTSRNTFNI